jgi:hypothetical protein
MAVFVTASLSPPVPVCDQNPVEFLVRGAAEIAMRCHQVLKFEFARHGRCPLKRAGDF